MASKNRNLSTLAPANTGNFAVSTNASITGTLNTADVNVSGNLIVTGTTVTVNVATLDVKDLNITVAKGAATNAAANGAGITVDPSNAQLFYTSSDDSWNVNKSFKASANLDVSGNISISGTGRRIIGDFSNATFANRVMFQTSTANGATRINAIPAGTGGLSEIGLFNNSDPANAGYAAIRVRGGDMQITAEVTGTGTYLPMTFFTGGSERLRIDTSGNVGIGTTSPLEKVDVRSGAITVGGNINGRYFIRNDSNTFIMDFGAATGTGVSTDLGLYNVTSNGIIAFGTNNTERIRINKDGDVGIGTLSPSTKLHVNGGAFRISSGAAQWAIFGANATSASYMSFLKGGTSTPVGYIGTDGGGISSGSGDNFGIRAEGVLILLAGGSSERARITAAGDVGIGTASPGGALGIYRGSGASAMIEVAGNNNTPGITSMLFGQDGASSGYVWNRANNIVLFGTNNVERARLDASGRMNIGGTSFQTGDADTKLKLYSSGTSKIFNLIQLTNMGVPAVGDVVGIGFSAGEDTQYGVKGSIGFVRTDNYGRGAITFYNTDAEVTGVSTSSEKMRIDYSGRVTKPSQPAFRAYGAGLGNYSTVANGVIPIQGGVYFNVGGHYSTSTSRFTAPIAGTYIFCFTGYNNNATAGAAERISIRVNSGVTMGQGNRTGPGNDWEMTVIVQLAVNDYVDVRSTYGTGIIYISGNHTEFAGYLLG